MKKLLLLAMFSLFCLPLVTHAWLPGYTARANISYAAQNINQTIWVNLSFFNVTVGTPKGLEIVATDFDDNMLPEQVVIKGFSYYNNDNVNVSNPWRNDNFSVVFLNKTTALNGFYLYFKNTTQQLDKTESIVAKYDNFRDYAIGLTTYPSWVSDVGQGAQICATTGGQHALCDAAKFGSFVGQHALFSVPLSNNNQTFDIEYNQTTGAVNGEFISSFGAANGYRSPQINPTNVYNLALNSGSSCGANASINKNYGGAAYNITITRDGAKVNLYIRSAATGADHISCDDSSALNSTKTEIDGGSDTLKQRAYLHVTFYNRTVLVRNQPALSGTVENLVTNTCTPTTNWALNLADNCTLSGSATVANWTIYSTGRGITKMDNFTLTFKNKVYGAFVDFVQLVYFRNTLINQTK